MSTLGTPWCDQTGSLARSIDPSGSHFCLPQVADLDRTRHGVVGDSRFEMQCKLQCRRHRVGDPCPTRSACRRRSCPRLERSAGPDTSPVNATALALTVIVRRCSPSGDSTTTFHLSLASSTLAYGRRARRGSACPGPNIDGFDQNSVRSPPFSCKICRASSEVAISRPIASIIFRARATCSAFEVAI